MREEQQREEAVNKNSIWFGIVCLFLLGFILLVTCLRWQSGGGKEVKVTVDPGPVAEVIVGQPTILSTNDATNNNFAVTGSVRAEFEK